MQIHSVEARGLRLAIYDDDGREAGHAFLYILKNNFHTEPFGLLEDVFVEESGRFFGIGKQLVEAVIAKARFEGCYKSLATSRNDGSRESIHEWVCTSRL